ncbi:hypothetical protein DPMN_171608 [Dreissena polymorpha]|uniref:Uncharacterized protein n=1 Tax=Dreissena polymorpha TaxID=45954 RepID=A0A9D4E1H0_DREPO|nr:hypothetical protein DPMN_171608 [Dreissena polymorpha]
MQEMNANDSPLDDMTVTLVPELGSTRVPPTLQPAHNQAQQYQGTWERKYLVLIFNHSCKTSTRTSLWKL